MAGQAASGFDVLGVLSAALGQGQKGHQFIERGLRTQKVLFFQGNPVYLHVFARQYVGRAAHPAGRAQEHAFQGNGVAPAKHGDPVAQAADDFADSSDVAAALSTPVRPG